MKLVILTSRFPYPLEKGDKLRIYHQIRELSQRHELILCSLSEEPVSETARKEMAQYCRRVEIFSLTRWQRPLRLLRGLGANMPFQAAWFYRPAIKRQIAQLIKAEQPDQVYCQLLRMAPYLDGYTGPATLDYMDCFSVQIARQAEEMSGLMRQLFRWEARKLARYEGQLFGRFSHHTIISEQDRDHLAVAQPERVAVVPNGVDTDYFHPLENYPAPYDLVFVGNMGYFPNVRAAVWLTKEILPKVWEKRPEVRLLLAGARPTEEVKRLGEDPRVNVTGWLADIREAYARGKLFIAPLKTGSGQQNKMLEALAMGRPCITTTLVNNAIGASPGHEIRLADTAQTLAEAICQLLATPAEAAEMGRKGRQKILNSFSWARSIKQLESLWEQG